MGTPIPKARPRFTRQGHVYTPSTTKDYEEHIKSCCCLYQIDKAFDKCLVSLNLSFYLPRPEIHKKKNYPETKPDIDNLIKAVLDGMNGVMFLDDKMIVEIYAKKMYSEEPRVSVEIKYCNQE